MIVAVEPEYLCARSGPDGAGSLGSGGLRGSGRGPERGCNMRLLCGHWSASPRRVGRAGMVLALAPTRRVDDGSDQRPIALQLNRYGRREASRHLLLATMAAAITMASSAFWAALPAHARTFSGWSVRDPHNIRVRVACDEPWRRPQLSTLDDYGHVPDGRGGYLLHFSEMHSCCSHPVARDTPMCSTSC